MTTVATVESVDAALSALDAYDGPPQGFVLRISREAVAPMKIEDQLVSGMQMAMITDKVLKKGWCPKGFVEEEAYRLYSYGVWENV